MAGKEEIAIAYYKGDAPAAAYMAEQLAAVANFQHFSVDDQNEGPVLSELLRGQNSWLLLLISDAFLRNANCMLHANRLLNHQGQRPLIVLLNNPAKEADGPEEQRPLALSRQSDIMHYINYWQSRFLDLRRQSKDLSEEGGAEFDRYLNKIRDVSGQVNDFLQYLKDSMPLRWEEFTYNDFEQFFIFIEQEEAHDHFSSSRQAEAPGREPAIDKPTEQPTQSAVQEEELAESPPTSPKEVEENLAVPFATSETEEDPLLLDEDDLSASEEAAAFIERAWAQADAGNAAVAIDLINSGREALPEYLELHYHHALLLATAANDPASAREEVDELLALYPDHTDALFLSGELYYDAQDYHMAREAWEQLADLEADYPELQARLGTLIAEHFEEDALLAASHLRSALQTAPDEVELRYRYALLLAGPLEESDKAISLLEDLVEQAPQHAAAHYELARLLHKRGDFAAAQQYYQDAKTLDPSLASPQNETAFATITHSLPQFMPDSASHTLNALKDNIAQLEALIQEQEKQAALEAAAEAEAKRPGLGKTVFISGATAGIGLAMARRFAQGGFRLILNGRRLEKLAALQEELRSETPADIHILPFDVRDQAAMQTALESLSEEWQQIDILINNAGKAKGFDPIHTGQLAHWDEMIDTNLRGLLYLTRAIAPAMVARQDGLIINLCSTAGKEVYLNGNVYCATKHAVDALTRAMRLDLVQHGVRVGQISPAHVEETEFALVRFDGDAGRAEKVYENFQPLRASDVAEAVFFMATQPPHVNILDMVIQGKQQASSSLIDRSGR